jgi:hypothetical protein
VVNPAAVQISIPYFLAHVVRWEPAYGRPVEIVRGLDDERVIVRPFDLVNGVYVLGPALTVQRRDALQPATMLVHEQTAFLVVDDELRAVLQAEEAQQQ